MTLVCGTCGARFRVAFAPADRMPCLRCDRRTAADGTVMGAMAGDILERDERAQQQRSEAA